MINKFCIPALLVPAFTLTACGGGSDSPTATPEPAPVDPVPVDVPMVISDFNNGSADGWSVTLAASESVSTDGVCGLVAVEADPGYLCARPAGDGDTSYFLSPAKFNGDLNVYSTLSFDLVTAGGSYYDTGFGFSGDISISNGVSTATLTFAPDARPSSEWTSFQFSLGDEAIWSVDDGQPLATVLQSVTELRIRAEFATGTDDAGLDNVVLQ